MKIGNTGSLIVSFLFVIAIFGLPYLWRQNRDEDISKNTKYAVGTITKKLGSLINGEQWYYHFKFEGKAYSGYRSTHIDYVVKKADMFLVAFSSKNPDHSEIYYDCKLNPNQFYYKDSIWDEIPKYLFQKR